MNSYSRIMGCFDGVKPDRVPIVPIVREWCCKQADIRFCETILNVEKHVFSQVYSAKKFGYDVVWGMSGDHAESEAMGSKLKYGDKSPPMVIDFAIKDYTVDLPKLRILNPNKDGRLPLILESISRLKELCMGEIPVMGYVQCPLRHAAMLRGTEYLMRDFFKKKEDARRLLEIVTDSLIVWGVAVVQAGADILQISDPTSSGDAISASFYREWGFPYTKRMVNALKGTGVKLIMHICGNTSDRLKLLADTGVHGLSLDAKVDFGFARETLGDAYLLMGNVEPTEPLAIGTPQMVYEHSKRVIDKAGRDGHFFLSGGCLIPEFAPVENMQAMFRAALETKY